MIYRVFIAFSLLFSITSRGAGFGGADFLGNWNTVLRATAKQNDSASRFVAVGRFWDGEQYRGLIASYSAGTGGHDQNFALNSATPGRLTLDFAGAGLDNLCNAVVYAHDGFIAACRSMKANGYYDVYLAKFNANGVLNGSFGTLGMVATEIGGNVTDGHAFVRGIAYNSNINPGGNGVVTIVGAVGFYGGAGFRPFIAHFNQATGAQVGSTVTVGAVVGTAVGVTYDSSGENYYMASTTTAAPHSFYVHKFDNDLVAAGAPWGSALESSASGAGTESIPAGIGLFGSKVVVVGGNKVDASTPPWRCLAVAVKLSDGALDDTFGTVTITGGTSNQGVALFSHHGATPTRDCILNGVAEPPSGTNILAAGAAYNGTNYDNLMVSLNTSGTLNAGFGGTGFVTSAAGPGDDVLNSAIYLQGSAAYLYGVGRSHNSSLHSGGGLTRVATGDGTVSTLSPNTWSAMAAAPNSVKDATVGWTGAKMIVWGGRDGSDAVTNAGALYDPTTNSWTAMSTTGAPSARGAALGIWIGDKLFVWGGEDGDWNYVSDGGIYNPATDTWSAVSTVDAPQDIYDLNGVWTGTEILFWGGGGLGDPKQEGYRYHPGTNTWSMMSTDDAPPATTFHSAVWTGEKLLVWGGHGGIDVISVEPLDFGEITLDVGGAYDPVSDTWTAISSVGAPSPRSRHGTVWTGKEMIVIGGIDPLGIALDPIVYLTQTCATGGGAYNPATDTWRTINMTGGIDPCFYPDIAWTGSRLIVSSRFAFDMNFTDELFPITHASRGMYFYDPLKDSWTTGSTTGAPPGRLSGASWSGTQYLIWGGIENDSGSFSPVYTGYRYTPPFSP